MTRVIIKVALIGEDNMIDEDSARLFTREGTTVILAVREALEDAGTWILSRRTQGDAFDITVEIKDVRE